LSDYVPDIDSLPIGGYDPTAHFHRLAGAALGPSSPSDSQPVVDAHIESILPSLGYHVSVNQQLTPLHANHPFKQAAQLAVDHVIILPVVERSVTIARISAREQVAKDFATEPRELPKRHQRERRELVVLCGIVGW